MVKEDLKSLVVGIYDLQKLRIQMGNRICANIKCKMGQTPGMSESKMDKNAANQLKKLRAHFKLITDGLLTIPTVKTFNKKNDGVFDDYTQMQLVSLYSKTLDEEELQVSRLKNILKDFPIYTKFLKEVKGCGDMMSAVIISTFDPHKAKYPSSFIKYAGLDVTADGKGRSKRKEHLIDVEYTDKDGKTRTKKGITFNPFVKNKMIGVLSGCFIKCRNSKYRKIYDDYKHRLENHKVYKDHSKGHRNNMALRYMVKMFLIDLHVAWRGLEGLTVSEPYHIAKLGYSHGEDK